MITPIIQEGVSTLKGCIEDLTAFAAEANKCTPELQAVMAMTINIAASPPFIFTPDKPSKDLGENK